MPTATATDKNPSHNITITDGSTTYGLNIVDGEGNINPRAFTRTPIPRTGIKTSTGSTKYGDFEFPYMSIAQDDWSGGRGNNNFDEDATRFADSQRLTSRHSKRLMLGGQETWTDGYRDVDQYMPGSLTWQTLTGSSRYIEYEFSASATYTAEQVYVWVRRRGSPGTLTCGIYSDSGGDPNTALAEATITTSNITDTVSVLQRFNYADQSLTSGTAYHIVIYGAAGDNSTNYWQVGTDAADTNNVTQSSSDGSSWSNASYDLYFRNVDSNTDVSALFFEYKGALYAVVNRYSTSPRLYINGDRGVVTGGGQGTTALGDSTKSWTTNEFAGATCVLTAGNGSRYGRYWSTITSNTGTVLTLDDALTGVPVADDTEYVIVGDDTWIEITGHGLTGPITDAAVFDDTVYFAQGDWITMRRMREFNSNATWTRLFRGEASRHSVTWLKVVHDVQRGDRLFGATNRDGHSRRAIFSSWRVPWGSDLAFPRLLEDGEDAWTASANVTASVDQTDYRQGAGSAKMEVAAGFTTGIAAYENITSTNLFIGGNPARGFSGARISFWAKSSIVQDSGDLTLRLASDTGGVTSIADIDLGDLAADEWTYVDRPITYATALRAVLSVAAIVVVDNGAFDLLIDGVVATPGAGSGSYTPLSSDQGRINGLEAYGDPEECWVFREGGAGHITNGLYVPVPLREMGSVRSRNNGTAHTVNGVYLYFSFLQGVQRYFKNNLDDVGPDRGEGLPDARRGSFTSMKSYPGRVFGSVGVDGTRFSSILDYNRIGWHETYRANEAGRSIDEIFIQIIPGWETDRLWFNQGPDLVWLPIPGNTLREDTDTSFTFTHEGTLESSWIYGRMHEIQKIYNSLKLIQIGFVASSQEIEADYRTDSSTAWTALPSDFDEFVEEVNFTSTTPPNVTGRRLRFRLRLQSDDNTKTPSVRASIVEAVGRVPIKYSYTFRFVAEDLAQDLEQRDDSYSAVETLVTQLDTWADSVTALTMRSNFSSFDNKSVLLDPASFRPIVLMQGEQQERYVGEMTLIEL